MRLLRCVACAALMTAAGCASAGKIVEIDRRGGTDPAQPRIMAYRVEHNAADHLALEVQYYYGGNKGECARVGAITKKDGDPTAYSSNRPAALMQGKHWARIFIGIADDAPVTYRSDAIEFVMSVCGADAFFQATVPFRKAWTRLKKPLQCHDDRARD